MDPRPNGIATLSSVNQFAAAANPVDWARVQAKGDAETEARLLALAQEWQTYMLWLADQP